MEQSIYQIIQVRRKELNLTEADVSRSLGWTTEVPLVLFEAGDHTVIPVSRIPDLARVLSIDPREFSKNFLMQTMPELFAAIFPAESSKAKEH